MSEPWRVVVLDDGERTAIAGEPARVLIVEGPLEYRRARLRESLTLPLLATEPARPPPPIIKIDRLVSIARERANQSRSRVPEFLQHSFCRRGRR